MAKRIVAGAWIALMWVLLCVAPQANAQTSQTITINSPLPDRTYGSPKFGISATSTSGLTVVLSSQTPSVCTISSGYIAALVGVGTCTIAADQSGGSGYAAAPEVTQSFAVIQTINFPALANQTYGVAPFAISATAGSGLPVTLSSLATSVCTVSGSTVTLIATGTCQIAANQAGNGSYPAAAQVTQQFTVNTGNQTISFAPTGQVYGGAPATLTATASSGLPVTYASATTSVCTVSGSTATLLSVGTCTIVASQSGNSNYTAAPQVTQSFSVTPGSQTIIFPALPNQDMDVLYYNPYVSPAATASSGLAIAYSTTTPAVCTISGASILVGSGGVCTVTADQPGNANYTAAPEVTQSFTVAAINFPQLPNKVFGAAPFTLSATASSGLPVTFTSQTSSVCTVSGSTVTLVGVGFCDLTASTTANNQWMAAQVVQEFSVSIGNQSINFNALPNQSLGTAPFALTGTATSGLPISYNSLTTAVCTISGSTVTLVGIGTCTINADQPGNSNYTAAAEVQQSFAVIQTINFAPLPSQAYGAAPFALSATASSGLPVSFTTNTLAVCTVYGTPSMVQLNAPGTCTITASQGGNGTTVAAASVTQSFTVTDASQTISFPALINRPFGAPLNVGISATASSGLTVIFSSLTPAVCTVAGATVTLVGIGTCTIAADQAGNSVYFAAPEVTQSFAVIQTINFPALASQVYGVAPFAVAATAGSGLPVTFSSLTTAVCTVSGSTVTIVGTGLCMIAADQAGNSTYPAAPEVVKQFTVVAANQTISFAPTGQVYGSAPVTLAATASSGLPATFGSNTPQVCIVVGNTVTLLSGGTCTITANQAGNANFNAAPQVTQSFAVTPAVQTISFPAPPNQLAGLNQLNLQATASSGLAVTFTSLTPSVCVMLSGSTIEIDGAGICTVVANQAGSVDYAAAPAVTQSFTVVSINFPQLPDMVIGTMAPFSISATVNSGLPITYNSLTPTVCSFAGFNVTLVGVGICELTATSASNSQWLSAQALVEFVVSNQSINFPPIANQTFGVPPFTLIAGSSSGLPVSFSTYTPSVCTVSGTGRAEIKEKNIHNTKSNIDSDKLPTFGI